MSTKAQDKAQLHLLLSRSKRDMTFDAGSDEHDFLLKLTRSMPVVYSELARAEAPKFCVKLIKGSRQGKSNLTVCVWSNTVLKTGKQRGWVPLPQSKIFASGAPVSKKKRVLAALRTAIKGQVDHCRASAGFPRLCPLTGQTLTHESKTHVDHFGEWPFIRIVESWLNLYTLDYENIALNRAGDLKDPDVYMAWYNYHQNKADLRIVDKTANLKKGAKGYLGH
jgi:hypothetical protein